MRKTAVLIFPLFMLLPFQNCSQSRFGSSETSSDSLGKSGVVLPDGSGASDADSPAVVPKHACAHPDADAGASDSDEDLFSEMVALNPACAEKGNSPIDLQNQNFDLGGNFKSVYLLNGGSVAISGHSGRVGIRAKWVSVTGNHTALCIRANQISISGAFGEAGIPTVLAGSGENSSVGAISGRSDSDLVLIGIDNIGSINGNSRDIYIDGGVVQTINGNGRNIFLKGGAKVKSIHGNFSQVINL
jgi:hypothetical protein